MAWFLDLYGSATEADLREQAVLECKRYMIALAKGSGAGAPPVEDLAVALWRCARSALLVRRLHREIAMLTDQLMQRQTQGSYWAETVEAGAPVASLRGTALATVALQRLGDAKHHAAIRGAVTWLIDQRGPDNGALVRRLGDDGPDVIATTLTMEAIRRSDLGEEVPHVLAADEAWLVAGQTVLGGWIAEPWSENFVAAVVLEYLDRRGAMLPQVDGFLLMARDFFRKAAAAPRWRQQLPPGSDRHGPCGRDVPLRPL